MQLDRRCCKAPSRTNSLQICVTSCVVFAMFSKLTQTCKHLCGAPSDGPQMWSRISLFSDLYTSNKSVPLRWECAAPWWLLLLDRCQIEMYCPAPWPCLWGISELRGMFAPASDPVMKYARAELCWRRWSLLSADERESCWVGVAGMWGSIYLTAATDT